MQVAEAKQNKNTVSKAETGKPGLFFQPKLTVNVPGDKYEQEADAMADKVMRMPTNPLSFGGGGDEAFFKPSPLSISRLQRKCQHCEEEEKLQRKEIYSLPLQRKCQHCEEEEKLLRKETNGDATIADDSTENYITSLNGKGKALTQEERSFFEPRFGYDFSDVQLHENDEANISARNVNALAYTHGNNIVFGSGHYQSNTDNGKRLMAHELTHVVQQTGANTAKGVSPKILSRTSLTVQREELTDKDATSCSPLYLQKLCVYIRGGFNGDRSGVETPEEMASYNKECQAESGYTGSDITLSDDEKVALRSPKCSRGDPEKARANARSARFAEALNRSVKYMPAAIGDQLVQLVSDKIFLASLAIAVSIYLALWFAPEPLFTKIAAAATTLAILSTGVFSISTILNLGHAWMDLDSEADAAKSDDEIERAAERFGKRMGAVEADLLVFLASLLVGGRLPGPRRLPAPSQALAQAESSLAIAKSGGVLIEGPWGRARAVSSEGVPSNATQGNLALKIERAHVPQAQPAEVIPIRPEPVAPPTAKQATAPGTGAVPVPPVVPGVGSKPATDEGKNKGDACFEMLRLPPGINARWRLQRPPILRTPLAGNQTTVLAVAYRLDHSIAPPAGQDTTSGSRTWVHQIGNSMDDAGHVIGNRFGGQADYNSPSGNIFPQDLSFNRGYMNIYDKVVEDLYKKGCDVCVNVGLLYKSSSTLRPYAVMFTYLYRSVGAEQFNPPISAVLPNP